MYKLTKGPESPDPVAKLCRHSEISKGSNPVAKRCRQSLTQCQGKWAHTFVKR